MSAPRPGLIDLRSQSQTSVARPLKSPRLHVAGDVPPELSPLDAFAMQSRLLAKQLEESSKGDNRVSRLPPLTTSSPLVVQARSDYFRSLSYDSYSGDEHGESPNRSNHSNHHSPSSQHAQQSPVPPGFNTRTPEVEVPLVRPQSMHPRMSRIPPTPNHDEQMPPPAFAYASESQRQLFSRQSTIGGASDVGESSFGARRERSPSPLRNDSSAVVTQPQADGQQTTSNDASSDAAEPNAQTTAQQQGQEQEQHRPQRMPLEQQQPHQIRVPSALVTPDSPHFPAQTNPYTGSSILSPFSQSPEKITSRSALDLTSGGLAPPRPFPRRASSIVSSPLEPTDEDGLNTMSSSLHSLGAPRKLSTSSGMMSSGLASPGLEPFRRTSSFSSDMSAPLPRPSFNFSRPLSRVGTPGLESRVGTPSLDSPARQASSDSHTSYSQSSLLLTDDAANTPVSMHSEGFPDTPSAGATPSATGDGSYTYSKFNLPRGKVLQRSTTAQSSDMQSSSLGSGGGQAPPSPPTRPASSSGVSFTRPSMERTKLNVEVSSATQPAPDRSRSFEGIRDRALVPQVHEPVAHERTPSISTTHTGATSDSASTIKPQRAVHAIATATEIPADEHVDRGVALHEAGKLNESTYHLRHAARMGHPTGMLLYALACRHGWGMRANPREGAEWLRKAADCASLEIADEEAMIKEGKNVNSLERKTHKAQFALSIYELGVSYMNGWGIDQDKALALRCFEIAGSWGDVDALTEAGFCYAQGIGCKKDLKKSAKLYRQAEAKGMVMPGNSWIHKSKYNDDKDKDDKSSTKSRSRSIFGIKH